LAPQIHAANLSRTTQSTRKSFRRPEIIVLSTENLKFILFYFSGP
jgi:hypothetical protein